MRSFLSVGCGGRERQLFIVGDSTQRQFARSFEWFVGWAKRKLGNVDACLRAQYVEANDAQAIAGALSQAPLRAALLQGKADSNRSAGRVPLIVIATGLHDACYGDSLRSIETSLSALFSSLRGARNVIWRSELTFHFHPWGKQHQELTWIPLCPFMTPSRLHHINDFALRVADEDGHPVWNTFEINKHNFLDGRDGTHVCFFSERDAIPFKNESASLETTPMPPNRQCHVFMQTLLVLILQADRTEVANSPSPTNRPARVGRAVVAGLKSNNFTQLL